MIAGESSKDKSTKSGYRTMLLSVLMSAPGPIILGLGLRVGHSSTQISDFTRRSAELLALIVAFAVYAYTNSRTDILPEERTAVEKKGNTFTGIIMCVSGASMILVTLLSGDSDKGNVVPALAVSLLGVIANSLFWRYWAFRQGSTERSPSWTAA